MPIREMTHVALQKSLIPSSYCNRKLILTGFGVCHLKEKFKSKAALKFLCPLESFLALGCFNQAETGIAGGNNPTPYIAAPSVPSCKKLVNF